MPQEAHLVREVWGELKDLRKRGAGRLDEPKRPNVKYLFLPLLEEAAKTVPSYRPNLTRVARINLLLTYEVSRVQASETREQLILSFGLRDDLDNTHPKGLRILAATRAGESETNYGRTPGTETSNLWTLATQIVADCFQDETSGSVEDSAEADHAISQIEQKILESGYEPAPPLEARAPSADVQPSDAAVWPISTGLEPVRRYGYDQTYADALRAGSKSFLLHGDVGTGKSTLAILLAVHGTPDVTSVPILHLEDENMLVGDLVGYLHSRESDQPLPSGHPAVLMRKFAQTLSDETAPKLVILDAASDWRQVQQLLPKDRRDLKSIVIITSGSQFVDPYIDMTMQIENMTEGEAIELVKRRLAWADDDATQLAKELDCRPLAIEHACALLKDSPENIQSFCEQLRLSMVDLLDATPGEGKLTAIYRKLLSKLANESEARHTLSLLSIVLLHGHYAEATYIAEIWNGINAANHPRSGSQRAYDGLSKRSFNAALEYLHRLNLIQIETGGRLCQCGSIHGNFIRMHQLTFKILQELQYTAHSSWPERIVAYLKDTPEIKLWRGGQPVERRSISQGMIIASLFFKPQPGQAPMEHIDWSERLHLLAFSIRCFRQYGLEFPALLDLAEVTFEDSAAGDGPTSDNGRVDLAVELVASGFLDEKRAGPQLRQLIREIIDFPFMYDPRMGDTWHPLPHEVATASGNDILTDRTLSTLEGIAKARRLLGRGMVLRSRYQWQEAHDSLTAAFTSATERRTLESKSVAIEVARRGIELSRASGMKELARTWVARLDTLKQNEDWLSIPLLDRTLELLAQQTLLSFRVGNLFWMDSSRPNEEGAAELTSVIAAYEELVEYAMHNEQIALPPDLLYDFGRVLALTDVCRAARVFRSAHEWVDAVGSLSQCYIMNLAEYIINFEHDAYHNQPDAEKTRLDALRANFMGHRFLKEFQSPFWAVKAYLIAVALAGLCKTHLSRKELEAIEELMVHAQQMAESIGRADLPIACEKVINGTLPLTRLLGD